MSTVLKSLVERIITDAGFRKLFISKPQAILDRQVISRSERRAGLAGNTRPSAFQSHNVSRSAGP